MANPKYEKGDNPKEIICVSEKRELMNVEHLKATKQALQNSIAAKQAQLAEVETMLQKGIDLKCWLKKDVTVTSQPLSK